MLVVLSILSLEGEAGAVERFVLIGCLFSALSRASPWDTAQSCSELRAAQQGVLNPSACAESVIVFFCLSCISHCKGNLQNPSKDLHTFWFWNIWCRSEGCVCLQKMLLFTTTWWCEAGVASRLLCRGSPCSVVMVAWHRAPAAATNSKDQQSPALPVVMLLSLLLVVSDKNKLVKHCPKLSGIISDAILKCFM